MTTSRVPRPEATTPPGDKSLRMGYVLAEEVFTLKIPTKVNMKGKGRQKQEVFLTTNELERNKREEGSPSRREALPFMMSAFHPLGCLGPAPPPEKLVLHCLCGEGAAGWDQDLLPEVKAKWTNQLTSLGQEAGVTIKKTTRPMGALGETTLAGLAEASVSAMYAVIHTVGRTEGRAEMSIRLSKVRVTPLHGG